jgi:hypothetical protein
LFTPTRRVLDDRDVLGLGVIVCVDCGATERSSPGLQVHDLLDEMRLERDAVVGDDRDGVGELHRRERVVALADAGGDRVAQVPLAMLLAVLLAGEARALPFARRQDAGQLAFDVDAGLVTEAQLVEEARGVVDVGLAREHVVVRVARHDDRLVHVDRAVPARLVVAEAIRRARQLEEAGIADGVVRRALAARQRAEREERLDRRPGGYAPRSGRLRAACPANR